MYFNFSLKFFNNMPKLKKRMTPLLAVLLLFLCNLCDAETLYKPKCSNTTEDIASIKPTEDGVGGRYTISWCTKLNKNDTKWTFELSYNRRNLKKCLNKNKHSLKTVDLNNFDLNCTYVCLSIDVDLIFSACYTLQNLLPSRGSMRAVSTHNISNDYTIDTFSNTNYTGTTVNHGNYVSAHFYLGTIPATDFYMDLCKKTNDTYHDLWDCWDVRHNCSGAVTEVRCRVRAAPGLYDLRMTHRAAWVGAEFALTKVITHLSFTVEQAGAAGQAGAGGAASALLWAGAALGGLLAAAALALAARRARAATLKNHVLRDWLRRGRGGGGGGGSSAADSAAIRPRGARRRAVSAGAAGPAGDRRAGTGVRHVRGWHGGGVRGGAGGVAAAHAGRAARAPAAAADARPAPRRGARAHGAAAAGLARRVPLARAGRPAAAARAAPHGRRARALHAVLPRHAVRHGDGGAAVHGPVPPLRAAAARAGAAARPAPVSWSGAGAAAPAAAGGRAGARRPRLRGPRARTPRLPHGRAHLHVTQPSVHRWPMMQTSAALVCRYF